jgi:hypothetical protein
MIGALVVLVVLACVVTVTVYRTRVARADREAEREWLAEEQSWWAALRSTADRA